jgi:hypothetical protein
VLNFSDPNEAPATNNATPAGYTSMMLEMYFAKLGNLQSKLLLDLGPVCAESITYFAKRVKTFYVCDMFLRFAQYQDSDQSEAKLWRHLDYAPRSFDGLHLWDFIDHLPDQQAEKLIEICHKILKPGGKLLVAAFEERLAPEAINSFVVGKDYRITLRPQPHLDLPWNFRTNRKLALLMSGFPKGKSFLYRNGIREFLFQRD